MGSRPTIFCVTAESLRIYDLFRPARPRLVTHAVGLELEGVLPQLGLAWGQSGLARFDLRPTGLELRPVADQASPTHSVVRRRNVIFCMRRGALDVLDVELRRVGSIELEGSGQLLVVGDTLFATGRDGVMTFDVSKPREPRETGSYELRDVVHLEQAGFGFARASERSLFIRQATGKRRVVYLGDQGQMGDLADFEEEPWFAGAQRVGHLITRLNEDRRNVTIYEIASSTQLNQPQIEASADRAAQREG